MKAVISIFIVFLLITVSCKTIQFSNSLVKSVDNKKVFLLKQDNTIKHTFNRKETFASAGHRFAPGNILRIESDKSETLSLEISRGEWYDDGFIDYTSMLQNLFYTGDGYIIDYDTLASRLGKLSDGLKNNRIIRIKDSADDSIYEVRVLKKFSTSNFTVPILYQIDGSIEDFEVNQFVPSIAWGLRWNTDKYWLPYVTLEAIGAITRREDNGNNSLSIGLDTDISGWLQFGILADPANDWKMSFIIGLTPTSLLDNLTK